MQRRDAIQQLALGLTGLALSSKLSAQAEVAKAPSGKSLLDALSQCQVDAVRCQAHCVKLLEGKDTSIMGCFTKVSDLIDLNHAALSLVSRDSPAAKDLAAVLKKSADACAQECSKHAKHHELCAACEKACVALVKSIAATYA